jgi:Transposase DDE domain group 1
MRISPMMGWCGIPPSSGSCHEHDPGNCSCVSWPHHAFVVGRYLFWLPPFAAFCSDTNMSLSAERVVAFYNKRGTCEQWIKEGKGAIKWTRLSCRTFAANAVRLQLHALAYNLANFLRTLATPEPMSDWSLTTLKEKLIKIGAKVVSHGRYIVFQMAEVAIPRQMIQEILRLIAELRLLPPSAPA